MLRTRARGGVPARAIAIPGRLFPGAAGGRRLRHLETRRGRDSEMSREDYERWAREWDDARGTKSGEMPVGSLLTQFKLLTVDGRGVHFFRPVWPGDVDERPRLGTMAAYMTNFTDL